MLVIKDKWKAVVFIFLMTVFTLLAGSIPAYAGDIVRGDVDGNGVINGLDAVKMKRYFENIPVPEFVPAAADLNADSAIDSLDLELMKKYFAGVIADFDAYTTYSATGTIKDQSDTPLKDVTVTLTGEDINTMQTSTDENGWWASSGLLGNVVVTPSLEGYRFEPESQTISQENKQLIFAGITMSEEYFINIVAVGGGEVSPSGYFKKFEGDLLEITATPDEGWAFSHFEVMAYYIPEGGDGEPHIVSENNIITNPWELTVGNTSYQIAAVFVETFTASGTVKDTSGNLLEDVSVTLTQSGDSSVAVKTSTDSEGNWSAELLKGSSYWLNLFKYKYTFPSVKVDNSIPKTLTGTWTGNRIIIYAIRTDNNESGGGSASWAPYDYSGAVNDGTTITLTAQADDGFKFAYWVVQQQMWNGVWVDLGHYDNANQSITVNTPIMAKAYFLPNP